MNTLALVACAGMLHGAAHALNRAPSFSAEQHNAFILCIHAKTKKSQLTCEAEYATLYIPQRKLVQ